MKNPNLFEILRRFVKDANQICDNPAGYLKNHLEELNGPIVIIDVFDKKYHTNFWGNPFESYFDKLYEIIYEDIFMDDVMACRMIEKKIIFGNPLKKLGIEYWYFYVVSMDEIKCVLIFDYLLNEKGKTEVYENLILPEVVKRALDFVGIINGEGQFVYINEKGKQMVGIKGDLNGYSIKDLHDQGNLREILKNARRTDQSFNWVGEHEIKTISGKTKYVSQVITAHKIDGKFLYATIIKDMTFIKKVEEQIRKTNHKLEKIIEERTSQLKEMNHELQDQIKKYELVDKELLRKQTKLETIIKTTSDGYSFLDAKFRYVEVNDALCEILGYPREEIIGATPTKFMDKINSDATMEELAKRSKGFNTVYEVEIIRKDNKKVSILISGTPYYDEYGEIVGSFSLIKEITERKNMELDLIESKKQAEILSSYKSDFMANMSHEIRTPMNAIIGMTQLCLNTNLNEKQKNYLEKVNMASNTLLRMINDMLDFSKIESGMLAIEELEFSASRIVDNVASLIYYKAKEKEIFLEIDIDKNIPSILIGDPLRFEQIILNLSNNAIKFTHKGTVSLSLKMIRKVGNVVDLELKVKDTGIGIPKEKLETIFEAFIQTDVSVTRKYGGTGLGLTISKQLIELMQGTIEVKTKLHEGSEFIVRLPFEVSTSDLNSAIYDTDPDLFGLKVLLLDENPISTDYAVQILKSFTFDVDRVSHKEEGMEALENKHMSYDLIVVVQGNVDVGCEEFIRRVRMHPVYKNSKMILISSHNIDYLTRYKETGLINEFLMKPINASLLYETILEVFSDYHSKWYDKQSIIQRIRLLNVEILVVEDNAFNQIVARDILTSVGAKIEIAENGAIAIDKILNHPYDLVIMDVQMPIMDGYEATRRIREMDGNLNRDTKIIALTANALKGDREKCIRAGMNDYLAKPITPDTLINKVIEWIKPEKYVLEAISVQEDLMEVGTVKDINRLDKKNMLLELENLKIALQSGKISKIKSAVRNIEERNDFKTTCRDDLRFLFSQIDDYEYDEALESISKLIKGLEDGDYE